MLGIPLGSLGIGITLWEPPRQGGSVTPPGTSILLQDDDTSAVMQDDDTSFIILELT